MVKKTKANSLKIIEKKYKNLVPNFIFFNKKSYLLNKKKYFEKIKKNFKDDIIIRSSALDEDHEKQSKAGFYDSFKVKRINFYQIENFIVKVISKFKNNNDQIIIQKLIKNPDISGVIFTKDKTTNSHYYDINYDTSKKTDLITSGKYNPSIKSLTIYKKNKFIPKKFQTLIKIVSNLEKIFNNERLDIEFCIKNKKVYILQCRKLHGPNKKVNKNKLDGVLINLKKKFEKINKENPTLFGTNTVMSNMSDWNPAEMIGKRPSKLSLSLYSELITNSVWAKQRKNYGYKDVYPNKLMLNFGGSPFIDLRVDLNSFLPQDLNDKILEKLINFFIKKLTKKPELHDKIEFDLINTCYDFTLSNKTNLPLNKIEKKTYFLSLKKLTNKIINPKNKLLFNEIKRIEILKKKIQDISKYDLSHIQKIYYLINDCKNYGTLPFAGIARCAFISKSIVDSLKLERILDDKDIENFYLDIKTVSKDINIEFIKSKRKKNFVSFLEKYGHLRPSTYSILTKNYRENYKSYFSHDSKIKKDLQNKKFKLKKDKVKKIENIFKKHNLEIKCNDFFKFAKLSIEKREYAKLIFTKSIDEIFKNLKKLANSININSKNLDHLDIDIILKSFHNLEQDKLKKIILRNISSNKRSYNFTNSILTPDVITKSSDFEYFYDLECKENYISKKTTMGEIIEFKNLTNFNKISDKIVLIENADPGFDFLFSYKIKGLITKYGGSNSHMAIRCMELGLPAIIGVGDKTYEYFSNSKKIFIDCNNKNYSIIH